MIISMIKKELILLLKDKGTYFWLFILPILFIVMFSSIFSSSDSITYTIAYFDADGTEQSQKLMEDIRQIKGFELEDYSNSSLDEELKKIKEGKLSLLLVIPKGFGARLSEGAGAEIEMYHDAADDSTAGPVKAVISGVAASYQEGKLHRVLKETGQDDAAVNSLLTTPIQVKEMKQQTETIDSVTQIIPGYTVMFVFYIMITMIHNFLRDRDSGMLSRLQSTPLRPYQYLIGMWIPNMVVVIIQSTVLLIFGKIIYGLQIGNFFAISFIVLGLAVCSTGMGLLLSVLVSSENMGIAFVQLIAMGGAIVGGLWFPYDFLPTIVQKIGLFTPQYWAQRGMQDVMIRGADSSDIWLTLMILLLFGFVCLGISILRFRHFASKAVNG